MAMRPPIHDPRRHLSSPRHVPPQAKRTSPAKRGYGPSWRRLRLMVLARHPICSTPGCQAPSTDADHIVPLRRGGTNALDNLQGLCASCHSRKTAREDGGFGNRRKGG